VIVANIAGIEAVAQLQCRFKMIKKNILNESENGTAFSLFFGPNFAGVKYL